jgi:hypothetical protein
MHRYAGRHFALGRDGPPPSHSRVLRHAIAGLRRQRHGAEESGAVAATAILGSKRSRPAGPRSRHIGLRAAPVTVGPTLMGKPQVQWARPRSALAGLHWLGFTSFILCFYHLQFKFSAFCVILV